jgi:osmotically-inducible protein OsmY
MVTLTGSAEDKHELARALELISQVHGVRAIDDYVAVSAEVKKQDRTIARHVRDVLDTCFPASDVEVSVFGGIAVISGKVRTAATRDQMARLVSRQDGVKRVVDKLAITGR